jgi:FkbM family methyltransferase
MLRLLLLRHLPVRSRLQLLLLLARGRSSGGRGATVRLRAGSLRFASETLHVDLRAFKEIFVKRHYATDYRDAVVVDVGAHKGYFGALAQLEGARAVISVEPESSNFAALSHAAESFRAAGRDWHVEHAAAGAEEGSAELHVSAESWAHSLLAESYGPTGASETVRVVALAALLERAAALAGDRGVIVKVDAEGSECAIVLESPPSCWDAVSEVLLEYHDFAPCSFEQIASRLAEAGLNEGSRRLAVSRFVR